MTNFNEYNTPEDYNEPDEDEEEEYPVGYKNPPKHTQFKKGQSGNPKGRPKPSKNLAESLVKELFKPIQIKENGEMKIVKAIDAIAKKIVNTALQGNTTILKKFLESPLIDQYLLMDAINKYNLKPEDKPKSLPPELRLIVNKAKEMIRKKHQEEMEKGE